MSFRKYLYKGGKGGAAYQHDPLAGGDEAASLYCGQELRRRLQQLVHLRVGHALDIDECLLGNREEALHSGEAVVLNFLSCESKTG